MKVAVVKLPGVCIAAAGGDTAWCAAGERLLGFTATGTLRLDVPLAKGVTQLASVGESLIAVIESRHVAWLDPTSGNVLATRVTGSAPQLVSGGGAVWVVDRAMSRAWKVRETGVLDAPRNVQSVDRVAVDGDRLWWTTSNGTTLHDFDRTVDIGVAAGDRGAMVACAGSVWISVAQGLCRVGAWQAAKGPLVRAPEGPVPFLVCANGVLVGASGRGNLFVLDPLADAGVRALDGFDAGAMLSDLVAVGNSVWAFAAGKSEARFIRVRPG